MESAEERYYQEVEDKLAVEKQLQEDYTWAEHHKVINSF